MDINEEVRRLHEMNAIDSARPTRADMIEAFGAKCVERVVDEAGQFVEERYNFITPDMTPEQKQKNWDLFNEMMQKARDLESDKSNRADQGRMDHGVKILRPDGSYYHAGPGMEDQIKNKPGFLPKSRIGKVVYSGALDAVIREGAKK